MRTFIDLPELAYEIVRKAFNKKTDKAGQPYLQHLIRVKCAVPDLGPNRELITIALLHDLLEDCPEWTPEALRSVFPDDVVDAVVILTRQRLETYEAFIKRIVESNSGWAIEVKKADLRDNLDVLRLPTLTKEDFERIKKYHWSYKYLTRDQKDHE